MFYAVVIGAFVIFAFLISAIIRANGPARAPAPINAMLAMTNAMSKLKTTVDMFQAGIAPDRLRRGANESDLRYYIGYIAALSRCIAEMDGVASDGVMLTTAQIEASRLLGTSANETGDYAEGIELLPVILSTTGAEEGRRDGELDGRHVCNPKNPGPYYEKMRSRFDIRLPGQPV
jgi:hypothetical protein